MNFIHFAYKAHVAQDAKTIAKKITALELINFDGKQTICQTDRDRGALSYYNKSLKISNLFQSTDHNIAFAKSEQCPCHCVLSEPNEMKLCEN